MSAWYEIYRKQGRIYLVEGCCWGCAEGRGGEGHFLCFSNEFQNDPQAELLFRGFCERWQAEMIAAEYASFLKTGDPCPVTGEPVHIGEIKSEEPVCPHCGAEIRVLVYSGGRKASAGFLHGWREAEEVIAWREQELARRGFLASYEFLRAVDLKTWRNM